jgi:hypothetical protein
VVVPHAKSSTVNNTDKRAFFILTVLIKDGKNQTIKTKKDF